MRYYLINSRFWLATAVLAIFYFGTLIYAQSAGGETEKTIVKVDVYYESLCSDSMRFIANQLTPSYSALKDHLDITLIPYGKATHTRESKTGPWQFSCQHGAAECRGNKAQACGIHAIKYNEEPENHQRLMVNLVSCAMSARNPSISVPQCSQDIGLTEASRKIIDSCIESPLGDDLLAVNGDKTSGLEPSLKFVPTIVINGVYNQENQEEALNHFANLICRHLTEPEKPSICIQ